jgi:two-component system sensor histidine kinase/response regulator
MYERPRNDACPRGPGADTLRPQGVTAIPDDPAWTGVAAVATGAPRVRSSGFRTLVVVCVAIGAVWTAGLAALLGWNLKTAHRQTIDLATMYARAFFQDIQATRRWNSEHGGVYVPITEKMQPNPYLHGPDRDVVTTSGVALTKVNPAYMTRQIAAVAAQGNQVTFHITSLKPVRPENAPDGWETAALRSFEQGTRERTEIVQGHGEGRLFRYMAPLRTERSCLKCHDQQGYREGDVRGGISVSTDAGPLLASGRGQAASLAATYGVLWLVGVCGLGLGSRTLGRKIRALEASEEKHRVLFEGSADGVLLMTDAILDCNERICGLVGYTRGEIIGRSPADFSPTTQPDGSDSAQAVAERIRAAMAGERQCFHWQLRRKDGTLVDAEVSLNAVTVRGRKIIQATTRDVTHRKRAEAAIQESEKRYRHLFESLNDAVFLADAETGRILQTNRQAEILVGRSRDEILAMRQSELYPPGRATEYARIFAADAAVERNSQCDAEVIRRDGTTVPVMISTSTLTLGGRRLVLALFRDITDRKHAEEQLRLTQFVVDRVSDALFWIGPDARIAYVNGAACQLLGYSRDELLTLGVHDIDPCFPSEKWPEHWEELKQNGSLRFESAHRRKNGQVFPIEVTANYLEFGGREYNIAFVRDSTQRRRTEQALREAKAQAEAASAAKSEFLANMSHEIRTPMTAILGFAENMLDPQMSDAERFVAINTIRRNGEHLLQIINDILDLSKVEVGHLAIHRVPCSPFQIVADVQSLMRIRAAEKRLTFHVEYLGEIPETIQTDPVRLRQILVNLVGNAIKFTESGGVRLVTRFLPGAGGGLHGSEVGDNISGPDTQPPGPGLQSGSREPQIQFDVIDTGIGMATEDVARIFEPFTQADSSITRRFGGTGLGLTISKHLASMLGGMIIVDSQSGRGSTFRLVIDTGPVDGVRMIRDAPAAAVAQPQPAVPPTAQPKLACRVLLAEDGPDNQRLIAFVLKKAGAEVTIADNGQIAVDRAMAGQESHTPFDVILMDMQMPVMDGYEAASLLRQKGYKGPIIALTAHAMASDRQKCLDVGCDDYAVKPIDRSALIEMIARFVAVPAQV